MLNMNYMECPVVTRRGSCRRQESLGRLAFLMSVRAVGILLL